MLRILLRLLLAALLTLLTQIGGLVYLAVWLAVRERGPRGRAKRAAAFAVLYLCCTFGLVPLLAPRFGREKIRDSDTLAAHSFLYPLMNRNYAVPALHRALHDMGKSLGQKHPGIRLTYLDANFPFLDGFPLFPHLSHHDGKKIDVSFIYEEENGEMTDRKPSGSGYGAFSGPLPGELDQTGACEAKGYWQYGYAAYLTLGRWGAPLRLSEAGTRGLVQTAAGHPAVGKIFLEPHLQSRLGLQNGKIRFHGCHAVRHDDHLHVQLR